VLSFSLSVKQIKIFSSKQFKKFPNSSSVNLRIFIHFMYKVTSKNRKNGPQQEDKADYWLMQHKLNVDLFVLTVRK